MTSDAKDKDFVNVALEEIRKKREDCKTNHPKRYAACQKAYKCSD